MTFDSLAKSYDMTFGLSPVGRAFRFRVSERLTSMCPAPAHVIDIGCGTGEDALWLASQGYAVDAFDASSSMIDVARDKAARFRSTASFEAVSIQSLPERGQTYDVLISNFGALNCVALAEWTSVVSGLLKPSGRAFISLMGRKPFPEGARRGFGSAHREARACVPIGGTPVSVEYPSVSDVEQALSGRATVERVEALGCLVPGPGYSGFARRHPLLLEALAMGEAVVRTLPFFRHRGDHTLIELKSA
ncbi:MAG: class I SAM-dependent methyltransferase [Vicinamibacteria bacterium]